MKNTDPTDLMKLHDKIIRLETQWQDYLRTVLGLQNLQLIMFSLLKTEAAKEDFMFAKHYHTGYIQLQ